MTRDLRTFLDKLRAERPSDLLEIEREVSPRFETAAILVALEEKQRTPTLWFHKVAGTSLPLITNVAGSTGRIALGLGVGLRDVGARYAAAVEAPKKPRLAESAPIDERVLRGADVDLGQLPALVYHQDDSDRPYITAGIVVAQDPDTKLQNLSYHRLMIAGPRTTGIFIERGKHLDRIHQKYARAGQPMPIAVFIGAPPAWSIGALYSGSAEVEEYDVIGGLLGEPLEVVPALSQPGLTVPARAEIVLEGFVPPEERILEGPFGEFTGYGTGAVETPVFHVTALRSRKDPLFQDIVSGRLEHLMLSMPAIEYRTTSEAKRASANVSKVALVAPFTAVVALDKKDDREPLHIIETILSGDIYSKHVIVVDAGVDPQDLRQVMAAVALQVQADRRLHLFPDRQGTPLDPSCPSADGKVTKMGIDATAPLKSSRAVTKNRIPAEILAQIDVAALLKKR
ncbi:MAG: UbiD family decarboxylase [Myxococcota bacterium]